jgi:hypothetical protein
MSITAPSRRLVNLVEEYAGGQGLCPPRRPMSTAEALPLCQPDRAALDGPPVRCYVSVIQPFYTPGPACVCDQEALRHGFLSVA